MDARFLHWLILGCLTGFGFLLASLMLMIDSHPESGRWVYECLQKKTEAVRKIQPEVIILSGSNSLFGFSAKTLSETYKVPTVNAAVHAGLGPNYILDYGRKFIRPGRLFVLPMEYELYGKESVEVTFIDQVIGFDKEYFFGMPILKKMKLVASISWGHRLRLIRSKHNRDQQIGGEGYQSRTLNAYGDETFNTIENRKESMVDKVNLDAEKKPDYTISADVWSMLKKFVEDARAAGAEVVIAYPNIYSPMLNARNNISFFSDLRRRASDIGVLLIGDPEQARFDESLLFDTVYHQNSVGQAKATDRLYADLLRAGILPSNRIFRQGGFKDQLQHGVNEAQLLTSGPFAITP